jgi:tetratricopeptide (TPR) repeat protein
MALAALLLLSCSPASREARLLKRGKSYLEKKDYARAVLEFRSAEQAMPQDVEPYYQEGLAYVGLGNYQAAFQAFQRATQIDPKHVGALVKLTELLSTKKKGEFLHWAEQHGKTAVELSPENPDALNALALTELRLGNEADASRYLEQALGKMPQHLRSSMALAVVKLSHRDIAGAEQILKQAVSQAPQSPEPLIALSQLYLIVGKTSEAGAALRRALDLDPRNTQALLYLVSIESAAGRKDQAEELYRRMAALPDKKFRSVHALYLLQAGKTDAGLAELSQLYKQDPDDRNVRTRLVAAYVRFNHLSEARKLLDAVLNDHHQDVEALLQKSEIELADGKLGDTQNDLSQVLHYRPDSAEAHFLMSRVHLARGDVQNRHRELTEALSLNPKLAQVRIELARCSTVAGNPGAALAVLDQAPDDQKSTLPVITERNWALLESHHYGELRHGIDRGLAFARTRDLLVQDASLKTINHDLAGARTSLDEILKGNPEDLQALDLLAQTYMDQKQPKAALEKIRYYAAQRPKSAPLQFLLGRSLLALGKLDEARAAFTAAKAADPQYTRADLVLAQLEYSARRNDVARHTLTVLLASKNTDRDTQVAAHMLMGSLEDRAGNHAAELEHWRKVVDADRKNAIALNNLAYVLLKYANQPDEALKYALQAHQLAPDSPDIEDTLGWALYQKGLYSMAVEHLEHAVARDGKGTDANLTVRNYHLAMAYFKHGDRQRGLDVLEAALKTDPHMPEAHMAESVMAAGK